MQQKVWLCSGQEWISPCERDGLRPWGTHSVTQVDTLCPEAPALQTHLRLLTSICWVSARMGAGWGDAWAGAAKAPMPLAVPPGVAAPGVTAPQSLQLSCKYSSCPLLPQRQQDKVNPLVMWGTEPRARAKSPTGVLLEGLARGPALRH